MVFVFCCFFLSTQNENEKKNKKKKMKTVDNTIEKGYYIHSKKLGEGGFGVVKLATHLSTKQKVAIKIINKKKIGKDLFRVGTEIAALKVLRHQNIAKLLQVIENEDYIYLVMEYCCGGELFDYIVTRTRLSDPEAKKIIYSLVRVLGYIHEKGFAHRDIKPENILFDSQHNVKLIDFGLAASSEMLPAAGGSGGGLDGLTTCCGSPAYVAPELLRGLKYSGPAADVWSTGVLLYTLLVGRLPFCDQNLSVLYKKIKIGHYDTPPFLDPLAKDLLSRMLCTDPGTRIEIGQILQHPWMNHRRNLNANFGSKSIGIGRFDSSILLQDDDSKIDDQILMKCAAIFSECPDLNQLRANIETKFGYQTAAYWLIRENPSEFKDLSYFVQHTASSRRRSRSFSDFHNPKMAKISQPGDCEEDYGKFTARPLLVGSSAQPKTPTVSKRISPPTITTTPLDVSRSKRPLLKTTPNTDNSKKTGNCFQGGTVLPAQVRRTAANGASKKLFTTIEESPKNLQKGSNGDPIGFINRKIVLEDNNNKENRQSTLATSHNNKAHKSLEHAKQCLGENNGNGSVNGGGGDVTPKKSLIKRFLESATPRKSMSPRRFSINDKNIAYKTMTITNYTDVQDCIEHVITLLNSRQVNCKVKNFTIRCVLSSMNVIIVAFELELLVCRNTGNIAIQRKRLRGTSWDYLKICEELNKIQQTTTEESV